MLGMVGEPESEVVGDMLGPQSLFRLLTVPVGLPGQGVDIHQALQHDHLAVEPAVVDGASRVEGADRADQDGALWVYRGAVGAPELVPAIHVGRRNIVAMMCLEGEIQRVVELYLVAGLNVVVERNRADCNSDCAIGYVDGGPADLLTCGRAGLDH